MFSFITSTMYRCIIVASGVLYPAFNSYKALNRRDGYEQVKWMMYWIVFALFSAAEMITDILFSWLPLYYETKIFLVLWMVLPMTRGSSYLYRRIIHPRLLKHENDIDRYIAAASNKGCELLLEFGQHGMNFAANAVLQTADHLKRSYSVGDVSAGAGPSFRGAGSSSRALAIVNGTISRSQENMKPSASSESISNPETPGRVTRRSKQPLVDAKESCNQGASTGVPRQAGVVSRRGKKTLNKVDEEC